MYCGKKISVGVLYSELFYAIIPTFLPCSILSLLACLGIQILRLVAQLCTMGYSDTYKYQCTCLLVKKAAESLLILAVRGLSAQTLDTNLGWLSKDHNQFRKAYPMDHIHWFFACVRCMYLALLSNHFLFSS